LVKGKQRDELKVREANDVLQAANPILKQVRGLDQDIAALEKVLVEMSKECVASQEEIQGNRTKIDNHQRKRIDAEARLKESSDYLRENAQDEWLVSNFAGVQELFGNLHMQKGNIERNRNLLCAAESDLKKVAGKLSDLRKQTAKRKQQQAEAQQSLQEARGELDKLLEGRLLSEYRAEKDALQEKLALLRQIASLEEQRSHLEEGKPCPLCGSEKHPYAQGNAPTPNETEQKIANLDRLIRQADHWEATISQRSENEKTASKKATEAEQAELTVQGNLNLATAAVEQKKETLSALQVDYSALRQNILIKLTPLGIDDISDANTLHEALQERLNRWKNQEKTRSEQDKRLAEIASDIQRIEAIIETLSRNLIEKQKQTTAKEQELNRIHTERKRIYGEKNPDEEEKRFADALRDAEKALKTVDEKLAEEQKMLTVAQTRISELNNRIDKLSRELGTQESEFLVLLEQAGFPDEKGYLEAKLSPERTSALTAKKKQLTDRETELNSLLKDRTGRLSEETAKAITDLPLAEIESKREELTGSLKEFGETETELRLKLLTNDEAKGQIRDRQTAINGQEKEYMRWATLHELIGSADGKKYRNFAQGLTFEVMVGHANRQLQALSDRYLLVRDRNEPLDLCVIDNYQAGETRSTKNLSGGESFLVSLALALGLSKMASKNVRVDSLFLDEGFGALDDEALNSALETLSGLHQEGKLIGVISHVSALKDRIGKQIQVTPINNGRSMVSGPGCRKVI
jgi:DNA repair protein SbcC/Rad50